MTQSQREKTREVTVGESFQVVFIIKGSRIITFFTLQEICRHSILDTVRYYARRYGVEHQDYICKIDGIQNGRWHCSQYRIERGDWMQIIKVGERVRIESSYKHIIQR